jgi:tetratricopeptide (TPR) repeat protein
VIVFPAREDDARKLFAQANAEVQSGAYEAATHTLTQCVTAAERDGLDLHFSVYGLRGIAHYKCGRLDEALNDTNHAIDLIERELEADDQYARLYYQRAMIHVELCDQKAADSDFSHAVKFDPDRMFDPRVR